VANVDNSYNVLMLYTNKQSNSCLSKNLQWVNFLVLSLRHKTFHVVVTSNFTFTFILNITQTFLQVAKQLFSKTVITRCNGFRDPAWYRREWLREKKVA
jgi:hypothetical protein